MEGVDRNKAGKIGQSEIKEGLGCHSEVYIRCAQGDVGGLPSRGKPDEVTVSLESGMMAIVTGARERHVPEPQA